MKNFCLLFIYTLLTAFWLNAEHFQQSADISSPLGCDSVILATSLDHSLSDKSSDSEKLDVHILFEESESNEEQNPDSSKPGYGLQADAQQTNISAAFFVDFTKTTIPYLEEEPIYIRYSSLKIPFSVV